MLVVSRSASSTSPHSSEVDNTDSNTSLVDILICTPGRLLEHLQSTDGFTLNFLKYIVFDEADRLLSNAYDHWVRALMSSTNASKSHHFLRLHHPLSATDASNSSLSMDLNLTNPVNPSRSAREYLNNIPQIQRLMFSATLTDNPRKLSLSGVRNPLIIRTLASTPYTSAEEQASLANSLGESFSHSSSEYTLPTKLKEWLCICDTTTRPLYLISILYQICGLGSFASVATANSATATVVEDSPVASSTLTNICSNPDDLILIFTSSVETTHRLCRLLQLFNNQFEHLVDPSNPPAAPPVFGGEVQEINRMISSSKRTEILQIARQGGSVIKILISSDQLARGIDLQNIRVVINYDSPSHPRTYVHRVGRTARANRIGDCITMIKKGNLSSFEKMRNEIANVAKEEKGDESTAGNGTAGGEVKGQGRWANKMKIDRVNIFWKGMIGSSLREGKGKRKRDEEEDKGEGEVAEEYQEIFGKYQRALQHLNKILELESQKELRVGEC
jgi:ATP-dependent RNA helicase DDX51/DBP6